MNNLMKKRQMKPKIDLGSYIKSQREGACLTQKDLASALKISIAHLSDIENNKRTLTTAKNPKMFKLLAAFLECPEDYLYYLLGRYHPDDLGLTEFDFKIAIRNFRK